MTNTSNQEFDGTANWRFLLAHWLELIAGAISQWNTVVWEQACISAERSASGGPASSGGLQRYKKLFTVQRVWPSVQLDTSQLLKCREEFIRIASQLRDC